MISMILLLLNDALEELDLHDFSGLHVAATFR
jgi:hypothetical protein